MKDDIKIANEIDLPVQCELDYFSENHRCAMFDGKGIVAGFWSERKAEASAHAINNHDRLVAENKKLCEQVKQLSTSRWISINDELPAIGQQYHAYHYSGIEYNHGAFTGSWDDDFRRDCMKTQGYSHWTPLHEPPVL